jgi:class 3 adenylate cyclase
LRAASAALAIRDIINNIKPPTIGNTQPEISCQIGINSGATFVAEIGDPRGRREFNVLGDTVNTTARLMNRASKNQIILSNDIQKAVSSLYNCLPLGEVELKGRSAPMQIFELVDQKKGN